MGYRSGLIIKYESTYCFVVFHKCDITPSGAGCVRWILVPINIIDLIRLRHCDTVLGHYCLTS